MAHNIFVLRSKLAALSQLKNAKNHFDTIEVYNYGNNGCSLPRIRINVPFMPKKAKLFSEN